MGDKYVTALAESLSKNNELEKLDLKENRMSDYSAAPVLRGIKPGIRSIDLSYNCIGYSAIINLGKILASPKFT